jgi:hypothetical protein
LWFSRGAFKNETNFRVGLYSGVNLASARLNFVAVSFSKAKKRKQEKEKNAYEHKIKSHRRFGFRKYGDKEAEPKKRARCC